MQNKTISLACLFLFLAVAFGAFGAHGLRDILDEKSMKTFMTGVQYQFIHGLAILILGVLEKVEKKEMKTNAILFAFGILLFSFNAYSYALTHIKICALLMPFGGLFFLAGWIYLGYSYLKKN